MEAQDLKKVAEYSIDAYKAKFNGSSLDIITNPRKEGSIFFCCGTLPNGDPNYGAVGQRAKELLNNGAGKDQLRITVYETHNDEGKLVMLPILQAKSSANVLQSF